MPDSGSEPKRRRFDADYLQSEKLRDGSKVTLRLIRPEDKEALLSGLARLSPQSRFRRFLHAKAALTPAELKYLTEVDCENHVAIVAVAPNGDGLGIARFIRLKEGSDVAEAAVAVVDDVQGLGLGTLLLRKLSEAAIERGVTHFRATVLEANEPVWRLLDDAALFETELERGSGYVVVDIPLHTKAKDGEKRLLTRLLEEAARESLVIKKLVRSAID